MEFDEEWDQNPFTSSAWTAAAINGTFRFGIDNNGSNTVRITAVYLRVYYTRAADETKANTELWLLSSIDNGANWTRQEKSRNSCIGVPIMGHKHHLTNDRVSFIFGTGHYLFEWTDIPYGKINFDARDLRIYYNATEIDRTIDFPDLDNTEVRFKVQAAIASGKKATAADHILYFSNPNETTDAKTMPSARKSPRGHWMPEVSPSINHHRTTPTRYSTDRSPSILRPALPSVGRLDQP
jgi:hypothetical protein